MTKQRIAILTAWYPTPKYPVFGIFIKEQAEVLSRYHDVTLFVVQRQVSFDTKKFKTGELTTIVSYNPFLSFTKQNKVNKWTNKAYSLIADEHNKQPFDLVHVHDLYPTLTVKKISQGLNIPVVATLHNSDFINKNLLSWQESKLTDALPLLSKLMVPSGVFGDIILKEYNVSPIVVPNMIDTELFEIGKQKDSEPLRFASIGGLIPGKRMIHLTEAFVKWQKKSKVKSELHIYGDGIERTTIEHLITEKNAESLVTLHGFVSKKELAKALQKSHVLISNSKVETFGISIFEGLCAGLPVIYSRSGVEDLLNEELGIMLTDDKEKTLIAALEKMAAKYDTYDAQQLKNFVVLKYSEQGVAMQISDVYKEVTSQA